MSQPEATNADPVASLASVRNAGEAFLENFHEIDGKRRRDEIALHEALMKTRLASAGPEVFEV
jgi:hypothetical protein